jgi:hypothetical protein
MGKDSDQRPNKPNFGPSLTDRFLQTTTGFMSTVTSNLSDNLCSSLDGVSEAMNVAENNNNYRSNLDRFKNVQELSATDKIKNGIVWGVFYTSVLTSFYIVADYVYKSLN